MSEEVLVGNVLAHHPQLGYFLTVFDHRPETLEFMATHALQGGGPTWARLITAALELESPKTLSSVSFDDESDEVLVTSASEPTLKLVQNFVAIMMTDPEFTESCVRKARSGGDLE